MPDTTFKPGLEPDQIDGLPVGRDPRDMSESDLNALGHVKTRIISVIRAKCLDCCGGQQSEVRKCVATACPLWPYRMNANPFHSAREMTDEQRQAAAERLARARSAQSSED